MPDMKKKKIIKNLLKEDLRTLGIKFATIHHYSNELVNKNKEDFRGKKTFSGLSIKFILNSLKTKPQNIEHGIISIIQDIYCYSYKKDQNKLKEDLINRFVDSPIFELMQFLRNDEVVEEEKYKAITKDLVMIEKDPNSAFDMNQFTVSTFAYIYKDIHNLIEEINKCLFSLDFENMNYTFLSIFKAFLQSYLDRKGNDEEIKKHLKNKNINDLNLAKEDEYLKMP